MAYKYLIEYEAVYGDFLSGHIHWSVWFEDPKNKEYKWGDRTGGYAHTREGAMRKIRRAIKKYEKKAKNKFKLEGEL